MEKHIAGSSLACLLPRFARILKRGPAAGLSDLSSLLTRPWSSILQAPSLKTRVTG
jgi:hypothetical protein